MVKEHARGARPAGATTTLFAGLYVARREWQTSKWFTSRWLFVAANVVYIFLSGYYYFMLGQFYAAAVVAAHLAAGLPASTEQLWRMLRIPSFGVLGSPATNILMLINAPLFPFLFTVFVMTVLWFFLQEAVGVRRLGVLALAVSVLAHLSLGATMILYPFLQFLKATGIV